MTDTWKEMPPSDNPACYRTRRVDPGHPLDFFYGKDHAGRYIFLFKGALGGSILPIPPRLSGIDVSVVTNKEDSCEIHLLLLDATHIGIFKALCANLMVATKDLDRGDDSAGAEILLGRLRRWHELLRFRRDDLLSRAQILGLYGELLLLRDLFLPNLPHFDAVVAWRGPYGDEQDFLSGNWLVEVKTQLSSSDRKLKISSADQLDTASGNILICHQTVSGGGAEPCSMSSLNALVDEVVLELESKSSAALDLFHAALIEAGYVRRDEYGEFSWMLNGRTFFHVIEGFPAIVPSMLPQGVQNINYTIYVDDCVDFQVEEKQVVDWIF